jgi:hypothetical protein
MQTEAKQIHLLDAIFHKPIFQPSDFIERSNINQKTAIGLLNKLKKENILKVLRRHRGNEASILCFPALLNIAEGRDIF